MAKPRYLSAREAAGELGVSLPTLYAYVSRGLLRSEETGEGRRTRRYYLEDVERLKRRKEGRRNPERVAERALHTGDPVLESGITLITDDCVYYRGRSALDLARRCTVEEVAALIWTGDPGADVPGLRDFETGTLSPRCRSVYAHLLGMRPVEACQVLLPLAGAEDPGAYDLSPASAMRAGARILRMMARVISGDLEGGTDIARMLQRAWAPREERAAGLIRATLILWADHELNASAFTARCAASTGSTPYQVVTAGLAALQGARHGGAGEQVAAFLKEVESRPDVQEAVVDRLRRGEKIPGFGHAVYRDVDPRGQLLFELISGAYPEEPFLGFTREVVAAVHGTLNLRYNIDFALAALVRVLSLPPGAGIALFALGRTIGWIGHAIEQYQSGILIRPRARYVGESPNNGRTP